MATKRRSVTRDVEDETGKSLIHVAKKEKCIFLKNITISDNINSGTGFNVFVVHDWTRIRSPGQTGAAMLAIVVACR